MKSSDEGRSLPSGKISGPKSCSGSLASGGDTRLLLLVAFEVPGPPLQVPQSYLDFYAKVRDEKRKKHLGDCQVKYKVSTVYSTHSRYGDGNGRRYW